MALSRYVSHIELELKNVACFARRVIDLHTGQVTEVTGGNGRGKTTMLRMLKTLTSGAPCSVPADLVRDFEDKGEVTARIDDTHTVTRKLKQGETCTELTIMDADGTPLKRPAELLRSWFGNGTYLDTLALVAMDPKDRAKALAAALNFDTVAATEALRKITGKDDYAITDSKDVLPIIQQAYDAFYERRRKVHGDYDDAEAQAAGVISYLPAEWRESATPLDPPVEPQPLGDIHDRKRAAEVRNAERTSLSREIAELEQLLRQRDEQMAGDENHLAALEAQLQEIGVVMEDEAALVEQIRQLQQKLAEMQQRNLLRQGLTGRIENNRTAIAQNRERLTADCERLATKQRREAELGAMEDVTVLQEKIDRYEDQMEMYREALRVHGERSIRHEQARALQEAAREKRREHEGLDRIVKALELLPVTLMQTMDLPLPGMRISGEDIFIPDPAAGGNLRKFGLFGDADQLRFAAAMAMELSPVNILILDGIEKCDDERRLMLYQMAAERDFIVFSTRVTGGPLTINTLTGPDWSAVPAQVAE